MGAGGVGAGVAGAGAAGAGAGGAALATGAAGAAAGGAGALPRRGIFTIFLLPQQNALLRNEPVFERFKLDTQALARFQDQLFVLF